jgi:hypothetical protein
MKACRENIGTATFFITSALEGGGRSTPLSSHFIPKKIFLDPTE